MGLILPCEEVIGALGFAGERSLGLQVVQLETIVGTVDRGRDFDRRFRPTSERVRSRREQIATATRRGASMPPVDLQTRRPTSQEPRREFFERVPLSAEDRREISLTDPWDYAVLAEGVEAWGLPRDPGS